MPDVAEPPSGSNGSIDIVLRRTLGTLVVPVNARGECHNVHFRATMSAGCPVFVKVFDDRGYWWRAIAAAVVVESLLRTPRLLDYGELSPGRWWISYELIWNLFCQGVRVRTTWAGTPARTLRGVLRTTAASCLAWPRRYPAAVQDVAALNPRRASGQNTEVRILAARDHRVRGDERVLADAGTCQDSDIAADAGARADRDRPTVQRPLIMNRLVNKIVPVILISHKAARREPHDVTDLDVEVSDELEIPAEATTLADRDDLLGAARSRVQPFLAFDHADRQHSKRTNASLLAQRDPAGVLQQQLRELDTATGAEVVEPDRFRIAFGDRVNLARPRPRLPNHSSRVGTHHELAQGLVPDRLIHPGQSTWSHPSHMIAYVDVRHGPPPDRLWHNHISYRERWPQGSAWRCSSWCLPWPVGAVWG